MQKKKVLIILVTDSTDAGDAAVEAARKKDGYGVAFSAQLLDLTDIQKHEDLVAALDGLSKGLSAQIEANEEHGAVMADLDKASRGY